MSHELLVLAGRPGAAHSAARAAALRHAAESVPGFVAMRSVETPTALAAVVETEPAGGSVAQVERTTSGTRLTVALTARGVTAAVASSVCGGEGAHASVLLDEDGGLTLSTDGVALIPVYWGTSGEMLAASTHLASLVSLGIPADLDEQGVVEYLTFHHPLGTRTLLRHCRMMPAGGSLRWIDGRRLVRGNRPAFVLSEAGLSDKDALAAFAECWPQVIGDVFAGQGRVGVSLSGGMDSRAIAGAAAAQGFRPLSFTYGDSQAAEAVTAARVAEALGLAHLALPVDDDHVLAGARGALELLDGAHSPNEMYDLWFADTLRDSLDTVVNGHAGDPMWGNAKGIGLTDPAAVLDTLWRRYRQHAQYAAGFLGGGLGDQAVSLVRDSLVASLNEWDFTSRGDVAVAWAMANRQPRWGNMMVTALRRSGLRPQTPFLDQRFLALAARFSPEQRRHGALYLRVHDALFPRTAGIPRSDDGNAPRRLNHLYWASDSSHLRQLAGLTARHPLSGLRRAADHGSYAAAAQFRRYLGLSSPADSRMARRSVFATDLWLRTRPAYVDRLQELLDTGDHPLISASAVAGAVRSIRRRQPVAPAAVLGRVAAAKGWLTDYESRAATLRRVLANESTESGRPVSSAQTATR